MVEHYPGTAPVESGSGSRGEQVAGQAKQQGQQFAQQARQQASDLANRGAEQVKSHLANQKHEASQKMAPVQSALRETAEQLRRQGQGSVGQYADRTADQVERFSGYLRETDVDEILNEVRGFARSRPALFLGGAVALGFFGTRFLKSSSQQDASGGDGPTATNYETGDPATALPPATATGTAVGNTPTVPRTPLTDRSARPLGEGSPTKPPRDI